MSASDQWILFSRRGFVSCLAIVALNLHATEKADRVIVDKSESRLYLMRGKEISATFKVTFGGDPHGHKQRQGDGRTPEGNYVLDAKNASSGFHKSIHISYPNGNDRAAAAARGVDPGGAIMIHGQKNGFALLTPVVQLFNWTDGCIALSNADMDKVWDAVDVGTPIMIRP